jgi:hypothetical protein
MYRLMIVVWTENAKDKERICAEESVRELSVAF